MSVDDDDVNVSNDVVDDTVLVAVAAVVADVLTDVDSTTVIRNTVSLFICLAFTLLFNRNTLLILKHTLLYCTKQRCVLLLLQSR